MRSSSRRFFGIPAMILCSIVGCITTAHATTWARTYGGNVGRCVQQTSDGGYVVTGAPWALLKVDSLGNVEWTRSYEGGVGRWIELTSDGGYIIAFWSTALLKTDAQGDTLWTADYGIKSYCVQQTSDGGYIVVGGDNGYEADEHLILVKTNANGNTLWTKTYGELPHNRNAGFFVRETSDNGYIITGITGIETEEFTTGYLWLIRTDVNGDTLWTQEYGTGEIGEFNKGYCVRQTSDGGYIITGYRDFTGLWLLKTNANGDTLWTKIYNAPSGGTGYSVQETHDGGYIIIGTTECLWALSDEANRDLWLIKTDLQGDTVWTRLYGGEEHDVGYCVQQTSDSGYIATGYAASFSPGGLYLVKTDSLGLLGISERSIPHPNENLNVVSSLGSQVLIRYTDFPAALQVSVFDASGCKVDEIKVLGPSGSFLWGNNHPSGVYFFKVRCYNESRTTRVVLVH